MRPSLFRAGGRFFSLNKATSILMVGLDSAGKTTILYRMVLGKVVVAISTIGFNVEAMKFNGTTFCVWDIGGGCLIRPLYRHYYAQSDGIVIVVDATDRARVGEAREIIENMLTDEQLSEKPLLVLANKQDKHDAMGVEEVVDKMNLRAYDVRRWYVQPSSAITGMGFKQGLYWLDNALKARKRK